MLEESLNLSEPAKAKYYLHDLVLK